MKGRGGLWNNYWKCFKVCWPFKAVILMMSSYCLLKVVVVKYFVVVMLGYKI